MPNIGKDDYPKLWSLIFVLIIALTFCCFVMGKDSTVNQRLPGRPRLRCEPCRRTCTRLLHCRRVSTTVRRPCYRQRQVLTRYHRRHRYPHSRNSTVRCRSRHPPLHNQPFAARRGLWRSNNSSLDRRSKRLTARTARRRHWIPRPRTGYRHEHRPSFALYLVGTDPSTNLYVGLAWLGLQACNRLNARYESKWQTLPSSSAYRIKMETRLELDSKDGQAPSPTTVTTSETINSEKYPEGDQVSKRTLRDSFNIFEPRALPGAIPQMIMCPTFGFGVFFAGLYGTTLGYTHAGLFYTISAVSMIIIRMISKHFMDTVPAIKTMTGAVACGILCCLMLLAAPYGEPVFLASGIFYGLATGISLPLNQSVAVKNTPPERWGAANALFLLANDIGIASQA